jgi:WhiB family redox-sensing transcriptional regulator
MSRPAVVPPVAPLVITRLSQAVRTELVEHIAARWSTDAACATGTVHPDSWFTDPTEPGYQTARAVCSSCPVRRSCLAYALTHDEPDGIWGGADTTERAWLRLALLDGTPVSVVLGPAPRAAVA